MKATGKIIIQRHGRYHNTPPSNPENPKADELHLGRLTSAGIDETQLSARGRLQRLGDVTGIEFKVIYSPTYWFDCPQLGQRARDTALVVAPEIKRAGGIVVRNELDFRLGEALMFQTPFAQFLRERFNGQGPKFWEAWEQDLFPAERTRWGAESAEDVAKRVQLSVSNALDFVWTRTAQDTQAVAWLVTHGDCTVPYGHYCHRIPWDKIPGGYNDGIEFSVDRDGRLELVHIG